MDLNTWTEIFDGDTDATDIMNVEYESIKSNVIVKENTSFSNLYNDSNWNSEQRI